MGAIQAAGCSWPYGEPDDISTQEMNARLPEGVFTDPDGRLWLLPTARIPWGYQAFDGHWFSGHIDLWPERGHAVLVRRDTSRWDPWGDWPPREWADDEEDDWDDEGAWLSRWEAMRAVVDCY